MQCVGMRKKHCVDSRSYSENLKKEKKQWRKRNISLSENKKKWKKKKRKKKN